MSNKEKSLNIMLANEALEGRAVALENLVMIADRDVHRISDEDIEQSIEVFARNEKSTLGYAAASFTPVLLLLNSMPFFYNLNDTSVDYLVSLSALILGFCGFYFALYKILFLVPRRIAIEGYRLKLVASYRFFVLPRGFFKWLNAVVVMLLFPVGYILLVPLMIRVLLK